MRDKLAEYFANCCGDAVISEKHYEYADEVIKGFRWEGWIHKYDPLKGLQVERECEADSCDSEYYIYYNGYEETPCHECSGKITEPFTILDALEMIRDVIKDRAEVYDFAYKVAKAMDKLKSSHVYFLLQQAFGDETDWSEFQTLLTTVMILSNQTLTIPSGGRVVVKEEDETI